MRLLPALCALCLITGVAAQDFPEGIVFDDFDYASTEWEDTFTGDPFSPPLGPEGSLYGPNHWSLGSESVESHRMWYRYGWQESSYVPDERKLTPTPTGLEFTVTPGHHQGDGCQDARDVSRQISPQQIVTGFSARRGTWAARVKLGTLPDHDLASMIHAFWLIAPSSGWSKDASGADIRVTNELDHEWNNRFLGDAQPFWYSSTGADMGATTGWRKAPMSSPLGPEVTPQQGFRLGVPDAWTCRYTRGTTDRTLTPEACSDLLQGRRVSGLAAPANDVWATLLIQIDDEGTRFRLVSDGWGARLEMVSAKLSPAPQLPLSTLFSQHLYPGRNDWTCDGRADVRGTPRFEVDWFFYSEDPALSREDVVRNVQSIQAAGVPRLSTVQGARLERPDRPLVGYSGRWGYGAWTFPLSIDLIAPKRMAPGESTVLYALPPDRNGAFRTTWTVSTRYRDGRYEVAEPRLDPFSLPLTFPEEAKTILIRVRLEEVDDDRAVVRNETVQPVERLFMIRRRNR